jgi:hypothetical protein
MKTLIWKELRENVRWVPVPSLVILLVFLIDKPDEPMMFGADAYFFCLTGVVFGAALGFLQVFFDGHGDKRSLLLHRPLSPSRIFVAKALTGIGLYLLALGVPFVCLQTWFATPGNMPAPYHWRTSLPWLADILSGLVYYFAGMLTAQRESRWYGTRCLALLAAFFCSYLVWAVPEFWQALPVIGFMGTMVALAAWGSFLSGAAYPPQPRLAKLALAGTFLGALLIVSILGKQKIGEWFDSGLDYEYTIDRQGRVLFQRFKPGLGVIDRRDLEGHAVPDLAPTEGAPLVWLETPHFWSYRNSGRIYVKCSNDTKPGKERWYYDHARGRLFGYDAHYNNEVGSFGPNGFTPAGQQPAEHFEGEMRYRCNPSRALQMEYLAFPGQVYAIDYAQRKIRTLFSPPGGETVVFANRWSDSLDKKHTGLVVSTDKSFHFLTVEGSPVISVPRCHDRVEYIPALAGPFENPERFCVWYPSYFVWPTVLEADSYRKLPCYLHEYNLAGKEVACRSTPPVPYETAAHVQALFGLVTPLAEAAGLVASSRTLQSEARLQGGTHKSILLHDLDKTKYYIPGMAPDKAVPSGLIPLYIGLILLSALASAVACFLLARRFAFSHTHTIGWAVCGFLCGWVGLALFLALQEWPARVVCSKCLQLRVVARDTCQHCGARHAAPTPDGTEVFESAPLANALCAS